MGLIAAPPCGTYSCACKPAKRSRQHLQGLPWLTAANQAKVDHANAVTAAFIKLLRIAAQQSVPWIVENPQSSMLWHLPGLRQIVRRFEAEPVVLDQCGYGTSWRKRTTLMCCGVVNPARLAVRCRPAAGHRCFFSGQPHMILQGQHTARAAEFPKRLCEKIAVVMVDTAWCKSFVKAVAKVSVT